ncbi:MAG: precorrin-4 C(11)-methyltransferase [Deltaproteobacteria bacterium]|nr:precorrin-4 C(11)-methyltransferase [Deltaproteobacteria bacterium]
MKGGLQTIYFIGSGPGDPELITVKGKRLLEQADVVVYAGSLVKEKVLRYVKQGAKVYNSASMTLEEITGIMVNAAREGETVVRLHSGDPTLYSALREQIDVLERKCIPYEIVPGVSSAFASAATLKEELTIPGVTQTVIFTRLEGNTPVPEEERISDLAKHQATMCIFLSIGMMERVVEELKQGYPEDTPVAVVYRATWEDERIVRGSLKDIVKKVKRAKIKRQAMIIVGNVLSSRITHHASRLYDRDFEHGYRKKKV